MADYVDDDNLWKEDLFATLGVSVDVQDGELKKAYLKLAKKYHPDKFVEENEEKLEAQRLFSKITVAYDTLSDPKKKHHYLELRRLLASHLPDGQTSTSPVEEVNNEVKQNQSSSPTSSTATQPKAEVQEKESITTDRVKEDQARSLYNLGLEAIKKKKVDQAIDYFKQAISTKENIAEFHSQLGLAYQQKNWTGMAQSEFKLALKYNPTDRVAKSNLGSSGKNSKSPDGEKKGGFFSNLFNFGKKK
ncbi:MAG: DnaJ domain-containing protein [Candidatus Sericytochromatia bacterium]